MLKRLVPSLAAVAALPLFAQESAAQESAAPAPAATDQQVITVSATRLAESPWDQPYAFYSYDREELDTSIGQTALDRINYGPGVFIQHTAPNQTSPFIRGLTGEQSLLLVDGVRLSHAMMRPGPNQYAAMVPDVSLDRIDVILGASSVATGSDGLTGALDFRLAEAGRGVETIASPWADVRVDSANGFIAQTGVDGRYEDWAYSVEVDLRDFHDRVGGRDSGERVFGENTGNYEEIPNTAYDQWAVAARTAYTGLADHRLELNFGHTVQNDAPRPDGYAENSGKSSRLFRRYEEQAFTYLHARDRWNADLGWLDHLTSTLSWHRHHEQMRRARTQGIDIDGDEIDDGDIYRERFYDDTIDSFGLDLEAQTTLTETQQLTWGLTTLFERTANAYEEYRTTTPDDTDPTNATPHNQADWANKTSVSDGANYNSYGIFGQHSWDLTPDLNLLTGLRFSYYDWSFGDVDGDASDISGGIRGLWQFRDDMNVFAGVSKAFRAPNLKNLDGAVDRGSSGNLAFGNPELEPEVSYTVEAGWRYQVERDELAVTTFYTLIEDLIQRDPDASEFTNLEGGTIHGIEATWDYGIPTGAVLPVDSRLAVIGTASLIDAVQDIPLAGGGTREENLSRANRLYGILGLRYDHDRNYWAKVQTRWHDAYDDIAPDDSGDVRLTVPGDADGRMPGYAVVDLSAGWRSDTGNKSMMLFVENLLDKTYREVGSGTDSAGLNLGLEGQIRF